MKTQLMTVGMLAFAVGFSSCNNVKTTDESAQSEESATVVEDAGWIDLFDGKSLDGWHGFNKTGEVSNWVVEDGALVCLGAAEGDTGGDIVTNGEYGNFELSWEWKVDKGSNSGVMYHV